MNKIKNEKSLYDFVNVEAKHIKVIEYKCIPTFFGAYKIKILIFDNRRKYFKKVKLIAHTFEISRDKIKYVIDMAICEHVISAAEWKYASYINLLLATDK